MTKTLDKLYKYFTTNLTFKTTFKTFYYFINKTLDKLYKYFTIKL